MDVRTFGKTQQGREAFLIPLENSHGMSAVLTNYGARLVSILVPDRHGRLADVCLGYDSLGEYETRSGYLGATIGRWGNRIGGASFQLNGKEYHLNANDGANTLHGGTEGFDSKVWDFVRHGHHAVDFTYLSADGEEGFPGNLNTRVSMTLEEDGSLVIDYLASTDRDTVLNLTNHAYFNLAGSGTVHGHLLQVHADAVTATTADLIPTGVLLPVEGSPYDLRRPTRLGDQLARRGENAMFDSANGYDINYVLNGSGLKEAAVLFDPVGGREMRVLTDQPGIQVYSGQGLAGAAKGGASYQPYSGIALETQHYPDSVHHAHFPSTLLKAGESFKSRTVYRFAAR